VDKRRNIELSDRERQLIELAAQGHTDSSIAHVLGISEATVSTYWGRVRIKIGPYSRPELIATILHQQLDSIIEDLREQNRRLADKLQHVTGEQWGDPETNYHLKLVMEAPEAILIVRDNGEVEIANEEAARLFGYEREEIEGSPLINLIPERYRVVHARHREGYMKDPVKRKMAAHSASPGLRKSGEEFPIAASLAPVETAAGVRVMCIVRELDSAYTSSN